MNQSLRKDAEPRLRGANGLGSAPSVDGVDELGNRGLDPRLDDWSLKEILHFVQDDSLTWRFFVSGLFANY